MKAILISVFSCIILFCSAATIEGICVKVYDGDTIQVKDVDGGKFKIRFADIDAPEHDQFFGEVTAKYLTDLVLNQKIYVKFTTIDVYGRIVGTVYLAEKNKNVNEQLIKNGLVWWYKDYSKNWKFQEYEQAARKQKIGLWEYENNQPPWEFRKQQRLLKKLK